MTISNLRAHYEQIFETELNSIKLNDTVQFALDGPGMVMHPNGAGLTLGWNLLLTLKHNVLLGKEPIALHIPVLGILPPDALFKEAAKFLLENARNERHKQSAVVPEAAPNPLEGKVLPPGTPAPDGNPQGVDLSAVLGKDMAALLKSGQAGFKASAEGRKVIDG